MFTVFFSRAYPKIIAWGQNKRSEGQKSSNWVRGTAPNGGLGVPQKLKQFGEKKSSIAEFNKLLAFLANYFIQLTSVN